MLFRNLHASVRRLATRFLPFGTLLAVWALLSPQALSGAVPACPGLAGNNTYSDNLRQRLQQRDKLCSEQGDLYRGLFTQVWRKLEVCKNIASLANTSWDAEAVKQMNQRYFDACDRYTSYLGISSRICSSYAAEASQSPPSPTSVNGLEAMKTVDASYRRLACGYGLLEKSAWFSERIGKFTGRTKKPPSTATTDSYFSRSKNAIIAAISPLPAAVDRKLSAPGASEHMPQDQLGKLRVAMAQCQSAQQDLGTFEAIYQHKIYQELIRMYEDAGTARNFFAGRKNSFSSMHQQLRQRVGGMGDAAISGASDPILVRPNPANPTDPNIVQCPPDAELTAVERNLKQSVFYADKSTGEIGTLFRAKTIGSDGQPFYHDVTASHVALEDLHDPTNNNIAGVKAAPAGQMMDANDPKVFESSPATLDRARDVAMASAGYGPALPVKADDAHPHPGQEFVLAGHPVDNYASNYVNMSCNFLGYGAGERSGDYVLECPTANTSIGGMSGGPMVDPKTGAVWGVATNQGQVKDTHGNLLYSDNRIFISPIQQGANGQIVVGPQKYASGNCYFVEGALPQSCYVTPMGVTFR